MTSNIQANGIRSMTGFGRGEAEGKDGTFSVEIRSVNSRGLEAKVYLPPAYVSLEPKLRRMIKANVSRGKVDCRVRYSPGPEHEPEARLNTGTIRAYWRELKKLRGDLGLTSNEMSLDAVLRLPGALDSTPKAENAEAEWDTLKAAVEKALENFLAERSREGAELALQMQEDLAELRSRRERLDRDKGVVVARFREKLAGRIAELEESIKAKLEPGRLEMEVALYADRSDVSEELVRLEAHLARLGQLLGGNESPVGKAIEFLVQEIHREVNTLASKLRDLELIQVILEMKGSVERLREQIQNIE